MKNYFLLTITFLLLTTSAFSRIFRVGYNGTPLKGVDYSSITEVNDSVAKAGDTIQIYGGGGGSINKRLVILGFGYQLNFHPGLQSNTGAGVVDLNNPSNVSLFLEPGSDSSIIEGCTANIYLGSNKVVIRRCIPYIYIRNDLSTIEGLRIYSCYSPVVVPYTNAFGGSGGYPQKNIQIYNCISPTLNLKGNESTGSVINSYDTYINPFENPKIVVKNCITSRYSSGSIQYDNNIFFIKEPSSAILGTNNKWNQAYDSVFVTPNPDPNISGYDENNYKLRDGSPAKSLGIDLSGKPTDCGIFGGELAYRYRIAGQPSIPAFYKISVPSNTTSTNPYNITVSVRSNN